MIRAVIRDRKNVVKNIYQFDDNDNISDRITEIGKWLSHLLGSGDSAIIIIGASD